LPYLLCSKKVKLTKAYISPIYGVIFLFKYVSPKSQSSEPADGKFDHEAAENIFFAQQTIQNACGTQALLSVLLNIPEMNLGPGLSEFKAFAEILPPEVRPFVHRVSKGPPTYHYTIVPRRVSFKLRTDTRRAQLICSSISVYRRDSKDCD
jgi:hypothetical protein